jgi:phage tail sheath protein FI
VTARASEWKDVPIRRLGTYVEECLDRAAQWAVFEPNGDPLRTAMTGS